MANETPKSDLEKAELEKENLRLRERVAYLERGADVAERADWYAQCFSEYDAQVERLSQALEAERAKNRKSDENGAV